ncbi:hypothetical protein CVS27_17130 [Arthrobacter glacialis]|uniref:Uncharacterized protein n=1 Tax=Arthrobacter glacialis TaxID=1664 RepID=A0A2S3ZSQ8_ARTGL|nr:hypothetical protein CVS27_17130 [Arthrobacter glacialis]
MSKRRTIVPAPDEDIDPIDSHKPVDPPKTLPPKAQPIGTAQGTTVAAMPRKPLPKKETPPVELPTKDLNLQVTPEVMETIDFAKFKTKLTKREIVQRAVLAYWSEYRPKDL